MRDAGTVRGDVGDGCDAVGVRRRRRRYECDRRCYRDDADAYPHGQRRLFVARAPGLGRRSAARMVSVPRYAAGDLEPGGLHHGRRLYRCADRHRPRTAERSVLHLSDVDQGRERLLRVGIECRLRLAVRARPDRPAAVRDRVVRGRTRVGRRHRPWRGNPRDRYDVEQPAHRERNHRRRRYRRAYHRIRSRHVRHRARVPRFGRCRYAGRDRRQGRFHPATRLVTLRREDHRR